MKKPESKKKFILIALVTLLITVMGATYAYFTAQKGSGGSAQIEVGAGTTDSLQFTNGNMINIVANQDNFKKDGENQGDSSSVTAILTPNNTTKEASDMYNVYLVIEDNEFIYTTEDSEPELVLKVVNPESTEITSMNAVKYIEGVGFDITELKPGIYPIVKGYNISANEEPKVDNWQITVTLINLNKDQNKNAGKSFTGKVYITKDDLKETDLIKVNSISSTTTTNKINVDLKIGNEIGKVDKYYFAIEETTEKPEDIQTESVASALAKKYEESTTATYEFTTIDGEDLKEEQNYKIYGYGIDAKGFRSNIYETIVTTDAYELPTIESVSHEENDNSTTFTITGKAGTSVISKYQYSIDGKIWNDTSDAIETITISELEYNKSYDIRIRAVDEQGRYSNIWVETIKVIKMGTEEYPYQITTIEDLVKLSTEVNSGNSHKGEYYKLEKDLDFNDKDSYESGEINQILISDKGFTPIGYYEDKYFSGNFDGGNNTISGLYENINTKGDDEIVYVGLFGKGINANIKNLNVNGEINSNILADTAGIIGRLDGGSLTNVHNNVNINKTNSYQTGGLVGFIGANTNIKNSSNSGNITSTSAYVGGLVGCVGPSTDTIKRNLLIENSFNNGIITSSNKGVGGLVGMLSQKSSLKITNSHNGNYLGSSSDNTNFIIGGLVGYSNGNIVIDSSYNENSNNTNFKIYIAGGLIGNIENINTDDMTTEITNSYNLSELKNGINLGGLIGIINGNNTIIINKSYNLGDLDNSLIMETDLADHFSTVGGLISLGVGKSSEELVKIFILNSFSKSNIKAMEEAGGIMGIIANYGNYSIINTYNASNISAGLNVINDGLGIARNDRESNSYINNVFNIGDIVSTRNAIALNNNINAVHYNSYYKSTNKDGTVLPQNTQGQALTEDVMKNKSLIPEINKNFIDVLNENIEKINLFEHNSILANYELVKWKQGSEGYPILDYQTE